MSRNFEKSSGSNSNRMKNRRTSAGANKDRNQVSGSFKRQSGKKLDDVESIPTEVIEEESFGKDADSIKEESIVNEVESDSAVLNKTKKSTESIAEDSIIREEYEDDNHKLHDASQQL